MKKWMMLLVVAAVCASASWAQDDLSKTLKQKAAAANVYQKAQVSLTITTSQPEEYIYTKTRAALHHGSLQVQTTCSGVLLNAKGAMAVKKDCLPAINAAAKKGEIILFVDLKNLGKYQNWEESVNPDDIGGPLYYETDNASSEEFVAKKDFVFFSLPIRSQAVQEALNKLFPNGKEITAQQAVKLLNKMPAAKTVQAVSRNG